MKHILLLDREQYGYHIDTLKYCDFLSLNYQVTLFCINNKLPKVKEKNINVEYSPYFRNEKIRTAMFLLLCIVKMIRLHGIVFIHYFPYCYILKILFPHKKMVLDIRTLSVSENLKQRQNFDNHLKHACSKFKYVSVISKGVADILGVHDYFLLPLGAEHISSVQKKYQKLRLLYVGTFYNRHLEKTIEGLFLFLKNNPKVDIKYQIIGFGEGEDVVKQSISQYKLNKNVEFLGRKQYSELKQYFDIANIGVSFVPITDYYNYQPPTKTFEYVLSGLYCIATKTEANKEVISDVNGVLINDTSGDFCNALEIVYQKRQYIREAAVRQSLDDYTWNNLLNKYFTPILKVLS